MSQVFFEIHCELPREGPGDNKSTRKAYLMLKGLPESPRILDIGCGPGMQTIELAKISGGKIVALDNHQPFLDELMRRSKEEGLNKRITIENGNMCSLKYGNNSFDIIWSEGAIYIIGFESGLSSWKRLLVKDGYIVVSELSWLKQNPPEEIATYLENCYPAIKKIKENLKIIRKIGYHMIDYFVLPKQSWWKDYYTLIEKKLPKLKKKYKDDKNALRIISCEEIEIEMFRKYSDYFGYVFYIMQNNYNSSDFT